MDLPPPDESDDPYMDPTSDVKESEFPEYWRWNTPNARWTLKTTELPSELLSINLCEFLESHNVKHYEPSQKGREIVAEWFRSVWRSFRGITVDDSKKTRDRHRQMRETGAQRVSQVERFEKDILSLRSDLNELRKEFDSLHVSCISLIVFIARPYTYLSKASFSSLTFC